MGLCASLHKASTKTKISDTKAKMVADQPIVGLSYSYENIIKKADPPLDSSSTNELYEQLHSGVYLEQKKMKYWIEKESGLNCFMYFPRGLAITWEQDERYWRWHSYTEQDGVLVEMAELIQVCWLEVIGKLDKSLLSPNTLYEVVSIIKLENEAFGWDVPVTVWINPSDYSRKGICDLPFVRSREDNGKKALSLKVLLFARRSKFKHYVLGHTRAVAAGVLVWDGEGKLVGATTRSFEAGSAEEAEMVAMEVAAKLARTTGETSFLFEGDYKQVVQNLQISSNLGSLNWKLDALRYMIMGLCQPFSFCNFNWISRGSNFETHDLAKWAFKNLDVSLLPGHLLESSIVPLML